MEQVVTEKFPDNCRKIDVAVGPCLFDAGERESLDRFRLSRSVDC